jgi:hypothetical protein
VFLRWGKRGSAGRSASVSDSSDEPTCETLERQRKELQNWRACAQRVTLAWEAWLAADRCDRGGDCYRTFVSALADEERAAAQVERSVRHSEAIVCASPARSRR